MNEREKYVGLLATFDGLMKQRRFKHAYNLALSLVEEFPKKVKPYVKLSLACNMLNRHDEALAVHERAKVVYSTTPNAKRYDGDFYRDHALWAIRARQLHKAQTYLELARERHQRDENRMAGLMFVAGRLAYAQGDGWLALRHFEQAKQRWQQLAHKVQAGSVQDPPDPQWQFNCDWHQFKACMSVQSHSDLAKELYARLHKGMNKHGSHERRLRLAYIWRFGRRGNWLDDRLVDLFG